MQCYWRLIGMGESQAIGIRLENDLLKRVDKIGEEEKMDRSTAIRVLIEEGYSSRMEKKAAKEYAAGRITMGKAAEKAGMTIWEFEQYLVMHGYKSQYSVSDLLEEAKKI